MNIPNQSNLTNQTFNSEFIEFVWQFPTTSINQVIFKVYKNGEIYLHEETLNGEDESTPIYFGSMMSHTENLSLDELTALKDEVIEFLN